MMCHAGRHHPHHDSSRKVSREERQREFVQQASKFGMVFMLCVGIAVLTTSGFWPLWVLLFGAFVLAKEARIAYGPGNYDDEDDREPEPLSA